MGRSKQQPRAQARGRRQGGGSRVLLFSPGLRPGAKSDMQRTVLTIVATIVSVVLRPRRINGVVATQERRTAYIAEFPASRRGSGSETS